MAPLFAIPVFIFQTEMLTRRVSASQCVLQAVGRTLMRFMDTMASSDDYESILNTVKWILKRVVMVRARSVDYYYAGCVLPDCMKVPFFVSVGDTLLQ